MKAWTDYPFTELGDTAGSTAPVREIEVLMYDGDKYATVVVAGHTTQVKAAYCYQHPGRLGEVPALSRRQLYLLSEPNTHDN